MSEQDYGIGITSTGREASDHERLVIRSYSQHETNEIMTGMDKVMAEQEKKFKPPLCHFTPMFYDEAETESWWECKHCGHTKLIESHPAY